MTIQFMIPFFLYVSSAVISTIMAFEIYMRNRNNLKNRLAALIAVFLALFFFGEFVRSQLPITYSMPIAQYWSSLTPIFAMCFGIHFFSITTGTPKRVNHRFFWMIYYLPILFNILFVIFGPFELLYESVEQVGIWKKVHLNKGYIVQIAIVIIYIVVYTTVISRSRKQTKSENVRNRLTVFLYGMIFLLIWTLIFGVLIEMIAPRFPLPSGFYAFGTLFWMGSIRLAMVKYDFLPSIVNKYRILYEQSPLGVLILNEFSEIIDWNPAAHAILGISKNDKFTQFFTEEMRPRAEKGYKEKFALREVAFNREDVLITSNGNRIIAQYDSRYLLVEDEWMLLIMLRDVTHSKQDEQQIYFLAYHDVLTGLPNRVKFYDQLRLAILNSDKSGSKFAVLLLDLDRFKIVNDTLGHQVGDQLLQFIANELKLAVPAAIVARLGGDEFIILLPDAEGFESAIIAGEDIIRVLQKPFLWEGHEIHITTSIGISLYPDDGENPDEIIRNADLAMYRAKEKGSNQIAVHSYGLNELFNKKFDLANRMSKALEDKEFTIMYQPQVDFRSGRIMGSEALLRWNSPELGNISPVDFIPIAEETGIIFELGAWVLEEACRHTKLLNDSSKSKAVVSVNVSVKQLIRHNFIDVVKGILARTGLDPSLLCLEITESTVIHDIEYSVLMMNELIKIGIKLAIDDFGTGYSSLSVLKKLPIHWLKIDRSFINDMIGDEAIVMAILAMSQSMGIQTVAEGIETEQQYKLLKERGCNAAQGFWIARPLSAEDWEKTWKEQ